jgi:hypothetical protein
MNRFVTAVNPLVRQAKWWVFAASRTWRTMKGR